MDEFAFEKAPSCAPTIRVCVAFMHILALVSMFYLAQIDPPQIHKKLLVQTVVLKKHASIIIPPPLALSSPATIAQAQEEQAAPEKSEIAEEVAPRVEVTPPPHPKKEKIRDIRKISKRKPVPKKTAPRAPRKKTTQAPVKTAHAKRAKKTAPPPIDTQEQKARLSLVQDALSSIERSEERTSSRAEAVANSFGPMVPAPGQITSLASDTLSIVEESDIPEDPHEKSYYDELVTRLKLGLRLPEYGPVRVKLTLSRGGLVQKVAVISSKSQKNRDYIKKMLASMSFPNFGQNFRDEKEHTFQLNLSNELHYE